MANTPQQAGMLTTTLPPLNAPYLDSSVFMAHVKKETIPSRGTTRLDITTQLLAGAERRQYKIYTSTLTISEVRRLKEANKELTPEELPAINALFNSFMEHEWIVPIEVSRAVAEKAQEIGATYTMPITGGTIYRISPTDAIHLATAILYKCNVVMAWDKRLVNVFEGKPVEGVFVLEPYYDGIIPLESTI